MDNNFSLPEKFEEFGEARRNGFLKAKELKEKGGRLAGIFCTFTPVEILDAADVVAVSLCATKDETIPDAEINLPKNLCPLIKSSYGYAVTNKCPYTYYSDLIVGETTCDGKKKMYEMLNEIKDTYVLHLPQGIDRPYALSMWTEEIKLLKEKLEKKFNITITDEQVRKACESRNRERDIKNKIFKLNANVPAKTYYHNINKVVDSLSFSFDREKSLKDIEEVINDIEKQFAEGKSPVKKTDKRILITGCPINGVIDKTVKILEENGAVVCVMENCNGIKATSRNIDVNAKDIYEEIANRYMNIGCAVMTPNDNRMKMIKELVKEYKIEGIVDVILQSCHPFSVERYNLNKLAKELGVPYMSVETDYSNTDEGQLTTRFQAFIEML